MVAAGTIRTDTEDRLIQVIAALDGFTATPRQGKWHVHPPLNSGPKNRRWVVIGIAEGPLEPDAMAVGLDPSIDEWTIRCGIGCTDIADAQPGKRAVEAAVNQIADLFALDDTLGVPDGPRNLAIASLRGPYSIQEKGKPRFSWADFTITASADIWRRP